MTDNFEKDINVPSKEIIIDGVDVSGCESFYRGICCQEGFGEGASCKLFSDCLYKQLKRKEQELEQYKKSKQASYEALQKKCNELELENRKLKAENEELKNFHINLVGVKECEIKELLKLKQTLAEIKEIAETKQKQSVFIGETVFEQILQQISEVLDENI